MPGWGLAGLWPSRERTKLLVIACCLLLGNLFPVPPPSIKTRDHGRALMRQAMASLRSSAPPGAILLSDYQSGLLLGYYACGHGIVQLWPPLRPLAASGCDPYAAVTTDPARWSLPAREVSGELAGLSRTFSLAPGTRIWWFDAGWIGDFGPRSPADLALRLLLAPLLRPQHLPLPIDRGKTVASAAGLTAGGGPSAGSGYGRTIRGVPSNEISSFFDPSWRTVLFFCASDRTFIMQVSISDQPVVKVRWLVDVELARILCHSVCA